MKRLNKDVFLKIPGVLVKGHGVASGRAIDSPFPAGTIEMRAPFFTSMGINFEHIFYGTLNVSIAPCSFTIKKPEYTFKDIKWSAKHAAETFSLSPCVLIVNDKSYPCFVYYPHPETKIGHFKDNTVLEILSEFIPNLPYDSKLTLCLRKDEISVKK
jgi:hypothetical protein